MDGIETIDVATAGADTGQTGDVQTTDTQSQGDPGQTGDKSQQVEGYDGRQFDPKVNRALKLARETFASDPDVTKAFQELRDGYGRYRAVTGVATNGMKDITAWKTLVDSVGGPEGAATMMSRVNAFEEFQSKLAQGDISVFDADNLKDAMPALAPAIFERMAKDDPDRLGELVNPMFASKLAGTGLGDFISGMKGLAGDNPQMQQAIDTLAQWFSRNSQTGQQPGQKSSDPYAKQYEKFQSEKTAFEQQKSDAAWGTVTDSVGKYEKEQTDKYLAPYLKSMNLDEKRTARLKQLIDYELGQSIKTGTDPVFDKTMDAYRKAKQLNTDAAISFMKGKVDSVIEGIVREQAEFMVPGAKPKADAEPKERQAAGDPAPKSNGAAIPLRLAEKPEMGNIDVRATTDEMRFARQAILKDGRFVTWPKPVIM